MAPGSDDEPTGGNPEEGKVLSPEELDISDDERVRELDDGRYVVSSGDPIARSDSAGQVGPGTDDSTPRLDEGDASTADRPAPDRSNARQTVGPDTDRSPSELDARAVHEWLSADLEGANSRYGFDITASFDSAVSQQRMVSNDVVAVFESLTTWYAQQIDRNTPVEEVLGILLMEANVPVRYPPEAVKRAMQSAGLSPDDSIADLMEAVSENDGLQL